MELILINPEKRNSSGQKRKPIRTPTAQVYVAVKVEEVKRRSCREAAMKKKKIEMRAKREEKEPIKDGSEQEMQSTKGSLT